MRHITYGVSDKYPIVLLVKDTAFNSKEIEQNYVTRLERAGVNKDDLLVLPLEYQSNKAPVKLIKEYLAKVLPDLEAVSAKYIYCADAKYFKVLTGAAQADPHLGYMLPCKIKNYEHLEIILGVNHRSLIYNPLNEAKLDLSMDTFISVLNNTYVGLGSSIIKNAHYPSTLSDIQTALEKLYQCAELSCDIETFSLDIDKAKIGTITFCLNKEEGVAFAVDYVPFPNDVKKGNHYGRCVPNKPVRALLKKFFQSYQGTLRYHRAPFDVGVLIWELFMDHPWDTPGMLAGLEIMTARFDDTLIISYLALNSTAGNELSLKKLAHEYAGNWAQSKEDLKDILRIPLPTLLQYNLVDGLSTNYVFDKYYPVMQQDQQEELYLTMMKPSLKTIIAMQCTGMPMEKTQIGVARQEITAIIKKAEQVFQQRALIQKFNTRLQHETMVKDNLALKTKQHPIEKYANLVFNPNSGPQLQRLLYEDMGLPVIDRTKTKQPATGGKTLKKLLNHTNNTDYLDIIESLREHALASKILTSFIPAFESAIDKGDDKVWLHGNFNLGGTVSGRLSSSDPNMQNIPSGSTFGKLIKSCFQAPEGWLFAGADFASLEDRISALTTKDPNKLKVYTDGYDGHSVRAFSYFKDKLPGIVDTVESINSIEKDFPEIRQLSKAPTFLLTYGGTYHGLKKNLGFSEEDALAIEANYHNLYQVSDQWVQDKLKIAESAGYVECAFGLRLRTPLLTRTLRGRKSTPFEAESEGRTAGNALGQSWGLLNNRAANEFMEKVWASPYRYDILIVGQIHDAIYLLIRNNVDVIEWVNKELTASMSWQELPEIHHDTVKLGAELAIFYPSWKDEMKIPNGATADQIKELSYEYLKELKEKTNA